MFDGTDLRNARYKTLEFLDSSFNKVVVKQLPFFRLLKRLTNPLQRDKNLHQRSQYDRKKIIIRQKHKTYATVNKI